MEITLEQFQNEEDGSFMYLEKGMRLFEEGSMENEMWKLTRTLTCEITKIENHEYKDDEGENEGLKAIQEHENCEDENENP